MNEETSWTRITHLAQADRMAKAANYQITIRGESKRFFGLLARKWQHVIADRNSFWASWGYIIDTLSKGGIVELRPRLARDPELDAALG